MLKFIQSLLTPKPVINGNIFVISPSDCPNRKA